MTTIFVFYYLGMLTPHEFSEIAAVIIPVCTLYMVFIIKYVIVQKRYFLPGPDINNGDIFWSCSPLIALHIVEILLILFKDAVNGQDNDSVYWWLGTLECFLAAYAGFYLSDLFKNYPDNPPSKTF